MPGAGNEPYVKDQLDAFCKVMNFERQETVLELSDQWPMSRSRWWTVMMPKEWNRFTLRSWQALHPKPTVSSILPAWGNWPLHQEQDLLPDQIEFHDYLDKRLGKDKRLIESCDVCPVLLHSYGSVHRSCPCGCRSMPLSRETLQASGLRGFFVRSRVTNMPRFLHPTEAAVLMTIAPSMNFESSARDALCLVGNAAPPLQCLWVLSHLLVGVARHIPQIGFIKPEQVMNSYKRELERQVQDHFPDQHQPLQKLELNGDDDTKLQIWCHGSNTVASLLSAEHITLDWGHSLVLREGELLLPPDLALTQLSECTASLEHRPKRQCLSKPIGSLVIAVVHQEQLLLEIIEAGSFLFEALRKLKLEHVIWVVDETGALFSADYRVWESHRFFTLAEDTFPTLKIGHLARRAGGHEETDSGLSVALISYYTKMLCDQVFTGTQKPALLSPLWIDRNSQLDHLIGRQWLQNKWDHSNAQIIIPVAAEKHWILLCGEQRGASIYWQCFDGWNKSVVPPILRLIRYLSKCLNLHPKVKLVSQVPQEAETTCGTVLIAHLCLHLGLPGRFRQHQVTQLHQWLRQTDMSSTQRAGGPPDPLPQLMELLKTKGVEPHDVKARAQAAIDAIGHRDVQQALLAKNPWAALKLVANRPKIAFKFITQQELERHIQRRSTEKFGTAFKPKKIEKHKKKVDAPLPSASIDPQMVKLIHGYFVDEDEEAVPQIPLSAVVKDGNGLAVCTMAEASPFLAEMTHLSSSALALLILDDMMTSSLEYSEAVAIRFAAICQATEESLLLKGWLVQLGDSEVSKREQDDPMKDMNIAPTRVVKVSIYKDEIECDWNSLVHSPIKMLMSMAPTFILCRKKQCGTDCRNFHPPIEEEPDAVVHEIWSRRFQSLAGQTASAQTSDVFSAFLRVQKSALEDLLKLQIKGLYVEPRAVDAKGACPNYAIVWVSDASYEDVLFKFRTTAHVISIVRSKMRYGLRVAVEHEESVHKSLKPNVDYVKVSVQGIYHVHPLPFGTQRSAMQKLLGEWNWTARALQPAKGSQLGGAWTVGAEEPPPCQVLSAFAGEQGQIHGSSSG